LIGLAASWPAVLLLRFIDRIGKGVRTSPRDALIAESTPPAYRGKAFGFHRAADHAGAVAGPLLATVLLGFFAIRIQTVFILSILPGLLTLAVLLVGVRDTRPDSNPDKPAARADARGFWAEMPKSLRRFVGILFLFTLGNSTDAFLLLRAQDLGISVALIPFLWMVLHLVKMVGSVPAGILSDRLGRKGVIVAGWIIYAVAYAGFARAESPWEAWALFAFYGLYFALTEGVEKALIADLAPAHRRGSAFGLYNLMIGIGALPASLLFGWIWQTYGSPAAFAMGAAFAVVSAFLLWSLPVDRNARV